MTIQEAIKSGKPFTRESYSKNKDKDKLCIIDDNKLCLAWFNLAKEPPIIYICEPEYTGFEVLDMEDILADDWEVVE